MNTQTIPAELELVTDPYLNRIFDTDPKYQTIRPPTPDELAAYKKYCKAQRARMTRFDKAFEQAHPPQSKCKVGNGQVQRIVKNYISWYKRKGHKDRAYIMSMLEDLAREKGIILPNPAELDTRTPAKRIILNAIDKSRYDEVYDVNVYFDGEDYIGSIKGANKAVNREKRPKTLWDDIFYKEYSELKGAPENTESGKNSEEKQRIRISIEVELIRRFYEEYFYDDDKEREPCPLFISRKLWNLTASYNERRKRFFRKKDQVKWTAWWTITYDDAKFDNEEQFRSKLLNKFRNLAYLKKWKIMGVFEHGEDNNRLHFHGFFYIPKGSEIGTIVDAKIPSSKNGGWYNYKENTEFRKLFGINSYESIEYESSEGKTNLAKYTSKMVGYMQKGEKVYYSRYIPSGFVVQVKGSEIFCEITRKIKRTMKRVVLWQDVMIRRDFNIERAKPLELPNSDLNPYEIGLLDETA